VSETSGSKPGSGATDRHERHETFTGRGWAIRELYETKEADRGGVRTRGARQNKDLSKVTALMWVNSLTWRGQVARAGGAGFAEALTGCAMSAAVLARRGRSKGC
jgi:hypothetical protein